MADSDKNIIITPFRGATSQPNIALTGQGNDPIYIRVLDGTTGTGLTAGGALSFEGSAGQLFSVVNRLGTGSIFSVNDISGIPSIDVDANGTIEFAPFTGYVAIGLTLPTEKLDISGSLRVRNLAKFDSGISASNGMTLTGTLNLNGTTYSTNIARTNASNIFTATQFISGLDATLIVTDTSSSDSISLDPANNKINFLDDNSGFNITLYADGFADQIITFPDTSTRLAGVASTQTFTGTNTFSSSANFSAGISASGGVTFNSTIISNGYRYSSSIFDSRTSGFTLLAADAGKTFLIGACAATTNIYCPTGLPVGFQCDVIRRAAASQRIRIFESGTTIESKSGPNPELSTSASGGEKATIMQIATNVYVVSGDI